MRSDETILDRLVALADPTGNGQLTSAYEGVTTHSLYRRRPIPVTIRGVRYPSIAYAATVLNRDKQTVRRAMYNRTLDTLQPKHHWIIEGMDFDSIGEAAEFFKEPKNVVRKNATKVYS